MNKNIMMWAYYINDDDILTERLETHDDLSKEQMFLVEKKMSYDISRIFEMLGYRSKSELIKGCNSLRYLQQCISNPRHQHFRGSFCKDRFCPICSHIKSHKQSEMLFQVIGSIQKDNNYKNSSLIMVTLTQRNVLKGELKDEINKMNAAVKKMMKEEFIFNSFTTTRKDKKTGKVKKVKNKPIVQGTIRHVEVTAGYKKYRDRIEFHPHVHMLLLVKQVYFTNNRYYLSHENWIQLWRKYMDLDYDPNVDVRKVNDGAECEDIYNVRLKDMTPDGALKEVSKYVSKESDMLKFESDENGEIKLNYSDSMVIINELYAALKHKRDLILTGAFKKTKERLFGKQEADDLVDKMQDNELIDLFKNKKCRKCGSPTTEHLLRYSPGKKNYYELGESKLRDYKIGMNSEINKVIQRRILKLKDIKEVQEYDELLNLSEMIEMSDNYNPFEDKKNTDASSQLETSVDIKNN